MKQWKKLSVALLGVSLIGVLTACGTGSERSSEDNLELTVWTFTDELSTMINEVLFASS
ncbi:hypothetical protein P7H68_05530 [Enterococcus lactis]|uniref:hypothetical protein n=1 Tax=Enterococcus lactis TaxID=357441 RepID=UPI00288FE5F4|nr:hypothetical protein [Enterococcus lactis]MDT2791482.1 hypothetical protein [Enterococcus lactis]